MSLQVYMDGKFVPQEEAKVSIWDHGLLYGDGVFEGIRAYNGRVFKLEEHVRRLFESARALTLEIPVTRERMGEIICETCARNGIEDGYIRPIVTRGVGDLGLDPVKCSDSNVIVIADKISIYPPELYEKGMRLVTVSTRRSAPESLSPRIKSLNYLNNILGRIEVNRAGADEGLMLTLDGFVAECIADNIFIVKDGVLRTPSTAVGALKGITRDTVLELCDELQLDYREDIFTQHDIYVADECFVTGTAAEIAPVVTLDDRSIGTGKPGEITKRLMSRYHALARCQGTPINAD